MKRALLSLYALLFLSGIYGQRTCGSYTYYENLVKRYPELTGRFRAPRNNQELSKSVGIITIPVIVHIVYNLTEQNLSDQDVLSQMEALNQDFQGINRDLARTPLVFNPFVAKDCQIRFVLKKITRTKTNVKLFDIDLGIDQQGRYTLTPEKQPIKFTRLGGIDAAPTTEYLNIWVGNFRAINTKDSGLLGLGTFPGGPNEYDGVMIHYTAFGTLHAQAPYDKGRTATHEVGHWLNLLHIWGDRYCGDDEVDDTPTQESENTGGPTFPLVNCNNAPNGAMFMNYMDYVDDKNMFMFTYGQRDRMRAVFAAGGSRSSFVRPVTGRGHLPSFAGNDQEAPIISGVSQAKDLAVVKWAPVKYALSYEVSLKEVKSEQWKTEETKEHFFRFKGLVPEGLYEVKVTAQFDNFTTVGVPVVFIAYTDNFAR